MKKLLLGFLFALCSVYSLYAVKAYPYMLTKTQNDGTIVNYYLHGDEFFSWMTSEDGYLIATNELGYLEYANIFENLIIPTGVRCNNVSVRTDSEKIFLMSRPKASSLTEKIKVLASNAENKMQKAPASMDKPRKYPLKGSPRSLVILVNFSDVSFTSPTANQDFTNLLNQSGYSLNGGTGSARDYFIASSDSAFAPQFDVLGPYTLNKSQAYYGAESNGRNDANPAQMIIDAVAIASDYVDLSIYDTDGDKNIDNVFVYYAGYNQAEGGGANTIWPHRSSIYGDYKYDGVRIRDYACTSEFRGSYGQTMCGIGTFCHEFGHVLGLADLYVTDYSSTHDTPSSWDIMDQGSYNNNGCTPPTYSSFERFYLGWLTPIQLADGEHILEPLITANKAYIHSVTPHNLNAQAPNPKEYFMIENRQAIGFDTYGVPGVGMLVTHVVFNSANWSSNIPNNDPDNCGISIQCASGTTSTPAMNTYPGTRNVTICSFLLKDGTTMPHKLMNIREEGNNILFSYDGSGAGSTVEMTTPINDFLVYYEKNNVNTDTQTVNFIGNKVSGTVDFSLSLGTNYRIRPSGDPDATFERNFSIEVGEDSTFSLDVDVIFQPRNCSYDKPVDDVINVQCESYQAQFPITGLSRRPVYVVPPVAYEALEVSPYSFVANWSPVEDAMGYYLSVYNIKDEEGSETQDFNEFNEGAPAGWESNFTTVSTVHKKSAPRSVYFTKNTDLLISKKYFMPVSKVSFWLQCANTEGVFYLDAENEDGEWVNIFSIKIDASVRSKEVTVNEANGYSRFKMYYQTNGEGGLAFDDFTAYFDKNITFALEDYYVMTDTSYLVSNLTSGLVYNYKVKASDKDLQGRYENITDYSNEIIVELPIGADPDSRDLTITLADDKSCYLVHVDEVLEDACIFIYTIDGQLVAKLPVTSNTIQIPTLIKGKNYLVKYSSTGKLKRKERVGKLFFNL